MKQNITKLIKYHHRPKLLPIPRHDIHTVRRLSHGSNKLYHIIKILPTIIRIFQNFQPLLDHDMEGYFKYVNDILIVYNESET